MEQILNRPELQSAVAPFVIALLVYFGLRKVSAQAWLWAVCAAFLVSALLINGVTVTPLTGTRKIILLVLISFLAAALLPRLLPRINLQRAVTAGAAVLALLWVFWAVLARMEAGAIALFLAIDWRTTMHACTPRDSACCSVSAWRPPPPPRRYSDSLRSPYRLRLQAPSWAGCCSLIKMMRKQRNHR